MKQTNNVIDFYNDTKIKEMFLKKCIHIGNVACTCKISSLPLGIEGVS